MRELLEDVIGAVQGAGIPGVVLLALAVLLAGAGVVAVCVRASRRVLTGIAVAALLPALIGVCLTAYGYTISTVHIQKQLAVFGQDANQQIAALRPVWRSVANIGAWGTTVAVAMALAGLARREKTDTQPGVRR